MNPRRQNIGIISWLINHSGGLIKDQNQAAKVLLFFVVIGLGVTFYGLFGTKEEAAVIEAPEGYRVVSPPNSPPRLEPIK